MFIPPGNMQRHEQGKATSVSAVSLKSSHLYINSEVALEVFGEATNVLMVYYPGRRSLLIAPVSDELFKKLHKAKQHMLKERNLQGDKTIALHEILLDHQINDTNRSLEYTVEEGLGILKVNL
ncbi:MAG: hypothetical protein MI974_12490 [Chitinophagales bacterium]|nr:hypothetical protein [Chitinophagales bacterium]